MAITYLASNLGADDPPWEKGGRSLAPLWDPRAHAERRAPGRTCNIINNMFKIVSRDRLRIQAGQLQSILSKEISDEIDTATQRVEPAATTEKQPRRD